MPYAQGVHRVDFNPAGNKGQTQICPFFMWVIRFILSFTQEEFMKRILFSSGVCAAIMTLCLLIPFSSHAQQVSIEGASICTGVADREPVDAGTSFAVSMDRLYCYSKIANITEATDIVHVWYFGETERARVSLGVKPPAWRTYSSKIIQTHEIGSWRVEILDASGNLLETVKFEVTQ